MEVLEDWIKMVDTEMKFPVVQMTGKDIYDFNSHMKPMFKQLIRDSGGVRFKISQTKIIEYSSSHINEIRASADMSGTIWCSFRMEKPKCTLSFPTEPQ